MFNQTDKLMISGAVKRSRVFLGFFFLFCRLSVSHSQAVIPINENGLDSLLANRNGNILLLNIWATWCEPCREEFPDLVKLSHAYKGKKLEIVTISVDYPDESDEKIIPFIDSLHVPFKVLVADFSSQDSFIHKFDKEWTGAVPVTFLFDTKGKQESVLFGKQTYRQFKDAVDKLLKKETGND